jgi:hypothetical protein
VRSRAFTAGLGWDLATSGTQVYVAHGILGVGVYAISEQGEIAYQDSLMPGGLVRSVASGGGLLAAARLDGRIHLYQPEAGFAPAGQVQASGRVSRVRLVGSQLWVLSQGEDRLEIFEVSTPASPLHLGEVTTGAAKVFRRRFAGPLAFSYQGSWLRAERAERVQP